MEHDIDTKISSSHAHTPNFCAVVEIHWSIIDLKAERFFFSTTSSSCWTRKMFDDWFFHCFKFFFETMPTRLPSAHAVTQHLTIFECEDENFFCLCRLSISTKLKKNRRYVIEGWSEEVACHWFSFLSFFCLFYVKRLKNISDQQQCL